MVCGARIKPKPCVVCGANGTRLCDGPKENGKTCDASLCVTHAKRTGPDRDLCPSCAEVEQPTLSHRVVGGSSRGAGKDRAESVLVKHSRLVECQDCGAPMLNVVQQGRHGLIWRERNGRFVKVNCIGREVTDEEEAA